MSEANKLMSSSDLIHIYVNEAEGDNSVQSEHINIRTLIQSAAANRTRSYIQSNSIID